MIPKKTVSLIPGTMCDKRLWARLIPYLSEQFDCQHIAIEQCMTKQSMLAKMANELPKSANIIGFSMGGYLSLEFALNYPERINSLVLVCATDASLNANEQSLREGYVKWLENNSYPGMSMERLLSFTHPNNQNDLWLTDTIQAMDRELGKNVLMSQLSETSERRPIVTLFEDYPCQALFIGADRDNYVRPKQVFEIADNWPGSQAEIISNSGHMLPMEQPQKLANVLRSYYQQILP